jgi:LysR family transcriptional activator of nhaA
MTGMEWLNYHHLLYFYTVAREGGVAPAARLLNLAPPTISGQVRQLERSLGARLFRKVGRRLVLTDTGRTAFRYAEDIFGLGRDLLEAVRGRGGALPARLHVGVADVLPKVVVRKLLSPALGRPDEVVLVVREEARERLLAELAVHTFDVVLSDAPVAPGSRIKAFHHLLGECGTVFFAEPKLAARFRGDFPASLDGAPLILPTENTMLRRSLDEWLARRKLRPKIVAEVEDSSLIKVMGASGLGLFPAPAVAEEDIRSGYRVAAVGRVDDIVERFYAITLERKLENPAVRAICERARLDVFADGEPPGREPSEPAAPAAPRPPRTSARARRRPGTGRAPRRKGDGSG